MPSPFSELLRIDPLTECKNYLAFMETLTEPSFVNLPRSDLYWEAIDGASIDSSIFSAILFVEMNQIHILNDTIGFTHGDSVIRWLGILLREECNTEVYRVGGVEFAVLLKIETHEEYSQLIERILTRIQREANLLKFPDPDSAVDIALVFFDQTPTNVSTILMIIGEAMTILKNYSDAHFKIFDVTDFKWHTRVPKLWKSENEADFSFATRWISLKNIFQVLELGRNLDKTQQEAYTDLISGLPNLKAAMLNMEQALNSSTAIQRPFSILMIDGDNIRAYNSINYAAGDEMIRDMSAVIKEYVRPNDFVARWRVGDEFMVILPDTPNEVAKKVGERIRLAVKEASKAWRFPVTISIGIASFPTHGENINSLIDKAEAANKRAKDQGKDQVVVAEKSRLTPHADKTAGAFAYSFSLPAIETL
jgi:diguanylate cyclase (GGDEF)-like protein